MAPKFVEGRAAVAPVAERGLVERERSVVGLDRFGDPPEFDQHVGASAMSLRHIGRARDGLLEARQRLRAPSEALQDLA